MELLYYCMQQVNLDSQLLTQNLLGLPKTYRTYPKLTELTQNLPDLTKFYRTYSKITQLTQNLAD